MNTFKIIISPKSVIITMALLVLIWITYQARDVILLLFACYLIAGALFPVVDWMSKKMARGLAVVFIYVIGFVILATILIPFVTVLIQQIQEFIKVIPEYLAVAQRFIAHWEVLSRNFVLLPNLSQILSYTSGLGQNIVSQSINITVNAFTGLVAVFTAAVIIFFMLLDKEEIKNGLLRFFPEDKREQTASIATIITSRVGGYVRGQLLVMIIVGILTTIGLSIIGLPFALLLGLLAGIFEIIPILGPFLSAVPAVIIALAQNPWLVLWTILVYLIVQRFENSFLTPLTLSKFLDMHPIVIIVALLIAASTLGVIGVILSPAIAAVIYVLVQELYIKRINKES